MEKLLYKVPEVAEVLSLSISKTYELLGSGVLKSVLVDGSRRVRVDDLREYVENLDSVA